MLFEVKALDDAGETSDVLAGLKLTNQRSLVLI